MQYKCRISYLPIPWMGNNVGVFCLPDWTILPVSTGCVFLQFAWELLWEGRAELAWELPQSTDVALPSPTWHLSLLCCRNLVCLRGWAPSWPLCRASLTQPLPSSCASSSPPSPSAPATWPPPPSSSPFWLLWWVPACQNILIRTAFSSSVAKIKVIDFTGKAKQWFLYPIRGTRPETEICVCTQEHTPCSVEPFWNHCWGKAKGLNSLAYEDFAFWPKHEVTASCTCFFQFVLHGDSSSSISLPATFHDCISPPPRPCRSLWRW